MKRTAVVLALGLASLVMLSSAGCPQLEPPPADFSYSIACFLPDTSAFPGLQLTCDDLVIDLNEPVNLLELTIAPETRELVIVAPDVFSAITVTLDDQDVPVETPATPSNIARVDLPALRLLVPCAPPPASLEIDIPELGLQATVRISRDCRLFTTRQGDDLDPPGTCTVQCGMTDLGSVGPGGVITTYIVQNGRLVSGRSLTVAVDGVFRDDVVLKTGPSQLSIVVPHDATPDPVIVFEVYDATKTIQVARFCVY